MRSGAFAAEASMPFWLQVTGSAITAAWSLHFGGVLSHAIWPAVDCHQLFKEQLLTQPIVVKEGHAVVPSNVPGLGFDLNHDMVEKYKCEKPKTRPEPERLTETVWADGNIPFYEEGADTRLVPDDGSDEWRELYEKAQQKPVFR